MKIFSSLIVFVFLLFLSNINAQDRATQRQNQGGGQNQMATNPYKSNPDLFKASSTKTLVRTSEMMKQARTLVETSKNYTGKLAKASMHQRYAVLLFKENNFVKAVHHTRRARFLCFEIFKENNKEIPQGFEFGKQEEMLVDSEIIDNEILDKDAFSGIKTKTNISIKYFKFKIS